MKYKAGALIILYLRLVHVLHCDIQGSVTRPQK